MKLTLEQIRDLEEEEQQEEIQEEQQEGDIRADYLTGLSIYQEAEQKLRQLLRSQRMIGAKK